uniref:Aggrecan core protein-like n=1 Tax=Crassostrea virginica TaxID=6565 RepID=A0A8B8BY44_CRAVI|nr:aggrecan core protein-like [Crassostrea virginica]
MTDTCIKDRTEGKRTYCLASEERREVTPRTARPAADLEIASESAVYCGLPVVNERIESYTKEGDAIGINRAMHVKCSKQHVQLGSGKLVCLSNGSWVYDITCCDEGWKEYRNHCYFRNNTKLNQTDATNACRLLGAYLVEIDDAEENIWINKTLLKDVSCRYLYSCTTWTGANDTQTEGEFVWGNSGAKVNYTNWSPGNPHDDSPNTLIKDCVDLFYNGTWNDRPCHYQAAFICERQHKRYFNPLPREKRDNSIGP